MSKLGYIQNSYGKEIKIASANTYGYNVLSGSNLPDNTLILASPVSQENDDIGSYSIIITDYISNPVRLTYTLQEGSGIMYSDDSLKVNIDNETIIESNNTLTANINALVDNNTVIYEDNEIKLNLNKFTKADSNVRGLFKIDENTIKEDEGVIYVDTSKLKYANGETGVSGIFIGDNKFINVNNGIISLNQENFHKADDRTPGILIGNDVASINNGVISINTERLDKCSEYPGIVTSDKKTIGFNDNSELIVNTQNLTKLTTTNSGIFKYDDTSLSLNKDTLSVKEYNKIDELINKFNTKSIDISNKISNIDYLLNNYQVGIRNPEIFYFYCANLLTGILEKPAYLDQGILDMPYQFISTDFIVSTNCPFIISIKYEDNISPAISLYQINYDTINVYNGTSGLFEVFQTTEEQPKPIKFTFMCKNYYKNDKSEYSNKVKIKIIISYYNDNNINKSVIYSIVRFNSGYTKEIEYDDINVESYINKK